MKALKLAIVAVVAVPSLALAQGYIVREAPMSRDLLRSCMDRDADMRDRLDLLEQEVRDSDRENQALAREGDRLAGELRALDNTNNSAVAAYNARSDAHNRRVEAHNRRVADMNARAAMHNQAAADYARDCSARLYLLRDRDVILREYR